MSYPSDKVRPLRMSWVGCGSPEGVIAALHRLGGWGQQAFTDSETRSP